jgi:hypothetical protein
MIRPDGESCQKVPAVESGQIGRSGIVRLRPLYMLRRGDFRAYYRIGGDEVIVLAVTRSKDSAKRLKRITEKRRRYRHR